jgi:hydrogenase maturation protease
MQRILILAYGNPLRGADGVGWRACDELKAKLLRDEIEIVCLHQLTPEIAERVSWADAVIFVDAAQQGVPGEVGCHRLDALSGVVRFSHELTPVAILTLANELYGATPRAYTVTLNGQSFEHGETLSDAVSEGLPKLVGKVEQLVNELLNQALLAAAK